MNYITVSVEIERGRIVPSEPEKLPERGRGLLTVLSAESESSSLAEPPRRRVELPLIHGDGKRLINPTPEELDDSTWGH